MVETMIAVGLASSIGGPIQSSPPGPLSIFWAYSVHLSVGGWTLVGFSILNGRYNKKSRVKHLFEEKGFGSDIYNLMLGMRGGGSRLALMRGMEAPRHRHELAELTGFDWKEVDRQIGILEKYGLAKVYAQSGTMKLYQVTEQGKLLLAVMDELGRAR